MAHLGRSARLCDAMFVPSAPPFRIVVTVRQTRQRSTWPLTVDRCLLHCRQVGVSNFASCSRSSEPTTRKRYWNLSDNFLLRYDTSRCSENKRGRGSSSVVCKRAPRTATIHPLRSRVGPNYFWGCAHENTRSVDAPKPPTSHNDSY